MSAPLRIAAFIAVVAAVFAAALAVGRGIGPIGDSAGTEGVHHESTARPQSGTDTAEPSGH